MKNLYISLVLILNVAVISAQESFQLAAPYLKYSSIFFSKETKVELLFGEPNTQIHFTTNNAEPTEKDPIYTVPITITKNFTTIKARVFSKNYQASEVVGATFIQDGLPIKQVNCTPPNPQYAGIGAATLTDNQGGMLLLPNKSWLGFMVDTVEIVLNLTKKQKVKKVLLNMLQDQGSWIFLPERIDAFYWDSKTKAFQSFGRKTFTLDKDAKEKICTPSVIEASKGIKTEAIKVKIYLLKQIPDWHDGKGNKGWFFIDEVKVY